MLDSLITSQTRIKLLKKFFLNSNIKSHLRGLETEFNESSNGIRIELNRFEKAGLLTSSHEGNKKLFQANKEHPLFHDIHNIILKETGIDNIIENVIRRIGNLLRVYLTGDFACGKDSEQIDLILVGDNIDLEYLERKVIQAEAIIGRSVRYTLYSSAEAGEILKDCNTQNILPIFNKDREKTGHNTSRS